MGIDKHGILYSLMQMSFHFTAMHHIEHYVYLLTACSRVCQNEGTLDEGTCMCSCVGGFSGANCESECNVKKLIGMMFKFLWWI